VVANDELQQEKAEAAEALMARAWLAKSDATALVEFAVRGAVEQTLDTIMDRTFLPTTMPGARAERLYYVCRAAQRWGNGPAVPW
jgi:hypothetical protein